MTVENVRAILDTVKPGDIVEIVTDNQHYVYDGCHDIFKIMYDEEKELVISFRQNINYSQGRAPVITNYFEYEIIQQINVYRTVEHALALFEQYKHLIPNLTEEQEKEMKQMILSSTLNIPEIRGYKNNLVQTKK